MGNFNSVGFGIGSRGSGSDGSGSGGLGEELYGAGETKGPLRSFGAVSAWVERRGLQLCGGKHLQAMHWRI